MNKGTEKGLKSAISSRKSVYESSESSKSILSKINHRGKGKKHEKVYIEDTLHDSDEDFFHHHHEHETNDFHIPTTDSNIIDSAVDLFMAPESSEKTEKLEDNEKKYDTIESDFDLDIADDEKWDTDIELEKGK